MTEQTETPRLLRPREAAAALAISVRTLFDLAKGGKLNAIQIGRSVRYDPADLAAFIARQRKRPESAC
jgi:excisionase family DNA binding protein